MDSKPLKLENINSIQQFAELVTELIVKKLPVRDIYINKLSANEDNKVFYEFNDKCEDTTQIVPTNGKKSAWKEFQAKYRSYKSQPDRLQQIFTVEKKEIMNNVNNIVACVGCKGSMDSRFGNLPKLQTKSKLHPFYLNERNGVVNLSESITDNCELLFNILHSQDNKPIPCSSEHSTSVNSSRKINRRCPKHLIDAKKPDHITVDQWLEIWNFINDDTKQDAFSINYSDLFSFMTTYFNNHRNCDDCIDNILDAYQSITKVKIDAFESKEWIAAGCEGYKSIPGMKHITIPSDRKNSIKMICNNGLTKGMIENHAIDGSSAKTELLTCISGFMARRFCQLYILLHKDLQSWKLLYHIAIQCFKNNFYSRYSIADLTKLCAELEDNGNDGRNGKCKKKQRYRKRRKIAKQQVMHTDPSISLPISELKNIIPATCGDAKDVGDVADDAINELARYTAKKLRKFRLKCDHLEIR
ncbi:hypothetical protein GJ496_005180 [Pomphorhynchus laevis]|nr:hypothetical protein GJ496_005180 [Pomphorhynchus laevis]